jgi:16S rRNA (uracil1498-N3)-methyltransferase
VSEAWVFVEELTVAGSLALAPDEARHVAARRLRVGDRLVVFDGQGHRAEARIESLGKHSTVVGIDHIVEEARPDSEFMLASAIPKGDRLSTMLQMLTQLGLHAWQPLILEDSAVRKLDPASTRLSRILVESCKVSRRTWLLEVKAPCSLDEVLEGQSEDGTVYFGDRDGAPNGFEPGAGLALIGPEAGFSELERKRLDEFGARGRSFGPHNMRIETAAVAATVALYLGCAGDSGGDAGE